MNWGNKILLALLLFIGMMGYLVYRSINTDYELVSAAYYTDELAYQQIIDGTNRALQLSEKPEVARKDSVIEIRLPKEMKGSPLKGRIQFYCPSKAGLDKSFDLQTNAEGIQHIASAAIAPGRYVVKISWESQQLAYYAEQNLELSR